MMTTRDDLTPKDEARAAWTKLWDVMEAHDLVISAVTIVPMPRQGGAISAPGDTTPVMPFGKYAGKTVKEIAANDRNYLKWLATEADIRSDRLKDAIRQMWKEVSK
jgi:hypothetical protein